MAEGLRERSTKKGKKKMKLIAIVHEKGQYDDKVKYEFNSREEFKSWCDAMRGVLMVNESYWIADKEDEENK